MGEEVFGKIITKEEADKEFGPVQYMKELESSVLNGLCKKSKAKLMFKFIDGELVILGDGRTLLSSEKANFDEGTVFKVYSVSIIEELLNQGGESVTAVEQREGVLTITNSNSTLEFGSGCPPYC